MWDARHGIRDTGYEMRNARCEDAGFGKCRSIEQSACKKFEHSKIIKGPPPEWTRTRVCPKRGAVWLILDRVDARRRRRDFDVGVAGSDQINVLADFFPRSLL